MRLVWGASRGPEKFLAARVLELLHSEYVIGEGKQATKALHPQHPVTRYHSTFNFTITLEAEHYF